MLPTKSFLDRRLWERKYFDLWALVHFLNGLCFGFAIFFYDLPFVLCFTIFLVAIIFWEVAEFFQKVGEPFPNQVIDVLTGALGFYLTYKFVPVFVSTLFGELAIFTVIYIIVWTLAYYGFQSFAIHFDRELEKYKKSFSAAIIIYVAIMLGIFVS